MMKKKVKKIPKYSLGADMVSALKGGEISASSKKLQGIGGIANQAAIGGQIIGSALGIEQGQAAQIANGIASVLEGVPVIGDMLAAPVRLWGGLVGGGGSVDETTGEITKSSGLTRWFGFGRDDNALARKSNMIKNSIASKTQTQNLQADYYNNPNVVVTPNVLAAEGGIMRQPVDALVSKGELIYNPMTKKLSKVPGSKGKPNKADDVYARLYEGDVVISNSPTMLMANGKTPAQNLEGLVDKYATGGTVKAREAIIKKVVNWQEANKTKPQEYGKFDEGDPGFFSYLISNRTRPIDAVISEYMKQYGKTAKEFKGFDGSDKSFLQGLQNIINANDKYVLPIRFTGGKSFDQIRSMPISSAVEFNPEYWDYYNQQSKYNNTSNANIVKPTKPLWQPTENISITTHPEIDNVWSRHKTSDFVAAEPLVTTVPTVSKKKQETTVSKNGEVSKSSSGKKTTTSRVTTSTTPSPEDTVIRRPERVYDYEEPAKAVTTPTDNTKIYGRDGGVRYDYNTPERKVTPVDLGVDVADVGNDNYTGSDWRGNLYRMMVLTQPFWDKATAEPVNYESPVYKYMPTQIDVASQFRDTDQSYALAKYNFANLYPNTGAGMAAGLQAAANRAKQYADIRQYQTNAQNELIGKNVGIYNNFANEHARIMNEVYNKTAANRAAARNINRQNRAAALNNYGQMLRDDKLLAMEQQNKKLKTKILEPFVKAVYENSDELMPMITQYGINKNIKKKQINR